LFTRVGDIVKIIIFAVVFVIPIHYFIVQPYRVPDDTFAPLVQKGDIVLINRFLGRRNFDRGDLVLYRSKGKQLGKIIGLPRERVRINDGILSIRTIADDNLIKEMPLFAEVSKSLQEIGTIDEQEYFVFNESKLYDSPGLVDERKIIGKPFFLVFPFSRFSRLY